MNNLSPHLEGEERAKSLEAKLDEVLTISDELNRANALSHLAKHSSGELIDRVLDAVAAIRQEKWRPRVLASLSPQANEAQLARIFEMALGVHDKWHRAFALEALAHHAPPDLQDQVLRAILAMDDEEGVARALQHAGYLFSGELLVQALEKARAFTQNEYRSVALAGIADQFAADQRAIIRAEAQQAAQHVDDPQARAESMAALAMTVNEEDRAKALAQQLTAITCITSDEKRSEALVAAIPNLPDALLAEALDIALSIDKVNEHVSYTCAVEDLAPRLNDEQLKRALNDAVNVADGADRVAILVQLYTHVDPSRQRQVARFAFESMMAIQADWVRAQALGEVFGILDESQRDEAWEHAQSILPNLPQNEVPITMLVSIAAAFEGEQKKQVVDRTREFLRHIFAEREEARVFFQNEGIMSFSMIDDRSAMLVMLAGQVEQPERNALLQEALDMIDANADKWLHFKLMEPISRLAEGELSERATALAKQIHLPYSHKREATRMPTESECHPHEPSENSSLQAARRDLLSTLAEIRNGKTREALLSQYKLMFENTVPPLPANQITDQLIAVCRDWRWPAC